MPCDTTYNVNDMTAEEREEEIASTLESLVESIAQGAVRVIVGENGAVCFADWTENRNGVSDVCAVRRLLNSGSWEFRQALATAETMAGRQVNMQAIDAGVHSHDGGQTWGRDR